MKKIFLALSTLLMILCIVGTASSSTIGNDVIDRSFIDTAENFTMIDTNLMFTEDGFIDSWSFWAEPEDNNVDTVYLQTFKSLGGNSYELTGQNIVTGAVSGQANTFSFLPGNRIEANAGEYIGWTTSEGTVPFDYIGQEGNLPGPVLFDLDFVTTVGNIFTADAGYTDGLNRTYSISASVSPVPEPATMTLFGIGLLGLAAVSRRKKE